jgi:hypothetical protein
MSKRPLLSQGILTRSGDNWIITLSASHPSFADQTPVDVILWDSRPAGSQSEVEEIARIQQLEPEVIALSLSAEGSLGDSDFTKRFTSK